MADSLIDPASLEGDALTRWYQRSPTEIEQDRQAAAAGRHQDFFYGTSGVDPDSGFDREVSARDGDAGPGFTWIPAGPNRWRGARIAENVQAPGSPTPEASSFSEAAPEDGAASPVELDDPGPDSRIDEWMARRNSDLATQPNAEAAARDAWAQATRSGEHPQASRPSDLAIAACSHFGKARASIPSVRSPPTPARAPASKPGNYAPDVSMSQPGQMITYGALRAPAASDQELAELRRQQAVFANTTRKIDLQNSWAAAPVLAAPLAVMGLEGAAAWAARTALPEIEQAPLQFVERDPYLRVGDNWATRAGRRAHSWLEERLESKPGWDYEPDVPRELGRPLKPDVGTPQRNPVDVAERYYLELKPNTPSGRAAAARAVKKYIDATQQRVRAIYYNPRDFM